MRTESPPSSRFRKPASRAGKEANVKVNTNTATVNPVDISFDAAAADMAFTTGNMSISIKYPYTLMYIFNAEAQITFIEPVPVPYNPLTGTSIISELQYDYLIEHEFITEEQYEEITSSENDKGE